MVDKVWSLWQTRCPALSTSFGGDVNSPLEPFPQRPSDIFSTKGGGNSPCYTYSTSLIDSKIGKSCSDSGSGANGNAKDNTTGADVKLMDPSWLQNAIISLVPASPLSSSLKNRVVKRDTLDLGISYLPSLQVAEEYRSLLFPDFDSVMLNCTISHPRPSNKSDLDNNRCASPLPSAFIQKREKNEQAIREREGFNCAITQYWNCKDGYYSPSALRFYPQYNCLGLWQT